MPRTQAQAGAQVTDGQHGLARLAQRRKAEGDLWPGLGGLCPLSLRFAIRKVPFFAAGTVNSAERDLALGPIAAPRAFIDPQNWFGLSLLFKKHKLLSFSPHGLFLSSQKQSCSRIFGLLHSGAIRTQPSRIDLSHFALTSFTGRPLGGVIWGRSLFAGSFTRENNSVPFAFVVCI